jgi:hypothetical protein
MAFPIMNAKSVVKTIVHATAPSAAVIFGNIPTGPTNIFSVPAVVDVSGMEYQFVVQADSGSGAGGMEASTADASRIFLALSDGGPTGDNTSVAVLAAALTNTVVFTDTVPRDVVGTSTTDLDADDWVNFHITGNPTTIPGAAIVGVSVNYIYGKPGSIA